MSVGSTLKKALGFVAGILIPGASESTTDLTHAIQQELANAFGQAAYRATLTNLESGLIALASSIESAGGLKLVTTLVIDGIEALASPASAVAV